MQQFANGHRFQIDKNAYQLLLWKRLFIYEFTFVFFDFPKRK